MYWLCLLQVNSIKYGGSSRKTSPKPVPSPRNHSPRGGSPLGTPLGQSPSGSSMVSVTPRTMNGSTFYSHAPNMTDFNTSYGSSTGYYRPRPVLQSFQVSIHINATECHLNLLKTNTYVQRSMFNVLSL